MVRNMLEKRLHSVVAESVFLISSSVNSNYIVTASRDTTVII